MKCKCGLEAKLLTVKKPGPNQGKQFYACARPKEEQCDFFDWVVPQTANSSFRPQGSYQPRPLASDRLSDKDRAFGQAKGACFNKAVDAALACYTKGEVTKEDIAGQAEIFFQEFLKINADDVIS